MIEDIRPQKACEVGFENGIYLVNFIYPSGEVVPLRALFKESIAWTFDSIMKNSNAELENVMAHAASGSEQGRCDTPRSGSGGAEASTADSPAAGQTVHIRDEKLKTVMLLQPSIDYLLYLIQRCENMAIEELSMEQFFDVDMPDDGSREFSHKLSDKCDEMFNRVAKKLQEKGIDPDTAVLDKCEFAAMVDRCYQKKRIARSVDLHVVETRA